MRWALRTTSDSNPYTYTSIYAYTDTSIGLPATRLTTSIHCPSSLIIPDAPGTHSYVSL